MKDKICLVTGGTSGIGQAVAAQLAHMGAHVLFTGRDAARGASVVHAVGADGGRAEFLPADFSSLASVRALAGEVGRRCDRLHVLVNNAGLVSRPQRRLTADGFEETFAVNHLAAFLLTDQLRGLLAAAGSARVVTVSSEAHRVRPQLEFDNLQSERRYRPYRAYGQSKLANVLFTYELARRMEGTGVTATCLHPGVVRTRIWGAAEGVLGVFIALAKPFMLSAERSARSVTRLASDPALEGTTGRYFNRDREVRSSPGSYDTQAATRLWEESARLARTETPVRPA